MTSTTTPTGVTLVVAEVFGPTYQGEGPSAGQRASFIRTGGCNLTCVWCDSAFTWDADQHDLRAELTRTPVVDVLAAVDAYATPIVVVTGGEPLLHQAQEGWGHLLNGLARRGKRVEVETNGTVAPTRLTTMRVAQFNVSPKLANSGEPEERRIRPDVLRELAGTGRAVFKFVCTGTDDVDEAAAIVSAHNLPPAKTWIMPEGVTPDAVLGTLQNIAERALAHRFNLTPRLHTLIWGDERGR